MRRTVVPLALMVSAFFPFTTAQARSAVQRDVEGYAIATCLTKQSDPTLKDQGDAWASVIVQRAHGDLEPLHAVQEAGSEALQACAAALLCGDHRRAGGTTGDRQVDQAADAVVSAGEEVMGQRPSTASS